MWRKQGRNLPAGEATCQTCRAELRAVAAVTATREPRTVNCRCGATFETLDRRRRFCSSGCAGMRLAEIEVAERQAAIRTLGWDELADPESQIVSDLTFAVDARLDRSIIVAAGRRDDGLAHVEIVDYRDGSDWVDGRVERLVSRWSPVRVLGHHGPKYPGTIACPTLHAAITTAQVRHLGCPVLTECLASARVRRREGGWHWDRKPGRPSSGPLVLAAVAHHALVS